VKILYRYKHEYFDGFDASEGGTIKIKDIEIEIGPNSIVDQDGNEFLGEVFAQANQTISVLYLLLM